MACCRNSTKKSCLRLLWCGGGAPSGVWGTAGQLQGLGTHLQGVGGSDLAQGTGQSPRLVALND